MAFIYILPVTKTYLAILTKFISHLFYSSKPRICPENISICVIQLTPLRNRKWACLYEMGFVKCCLIRRLRNSKLHTLVYNHAYIFRLYTYVHLGTHTLVTNLFGRRYYLLSFKHTRNVNSLDTRLHYDCVKLSSLLWFFTNHPQNDLTNTLFPLFHTNTAKTIRSCFL